MAKPWGNRYAGYWVISAGVSALAAEDPPHVLVPFTEQVQVFLSLKFLLPPNFLCARKAQTPFLVHE